MILYVWYRLYTRDYRVCVRARFRVRTTFLSYMHCIRTVRVQCTLCMYRRLLRWYVYLNARKIATIKTQLKMHVLHPYSASIHVTPSSQNKHTPNYPAFVRHLKMDACVFHSSFSNCRLHVLSLRSPFIHSRTFLVCCLFCLLRSLYSNARIRCTCEMHANTHTHPIATTALHTIQYWNYIEQIIVFIAAASHGRV